MERVASTPYSVHAPWNMGDILPGKQWKMNILHERHSYWWAYASRMQGPRANKVAFATKRWIWHTHRYFRSRESNPLSIHRQYNLLRHIWSCIVRGHSRAGAYARKSDPNLKLSTVPFSQNHVQVYRSIALRKKRLSIPMGEECSPCVQDQKCISSPNSDTGNRTLLQYFGDVVLYTIFEVAWWEDVRGKVDTPGNRMDTWIETGRYVYFRNESWRYAARTLERNRFSEQ